MPQARSSTAFEFHPAKFENCVRRPVSRPARAGGMA